MSPLAELKMEFRDISAEIASVSANYASHKLPVWWLRLQEILRQLCQWLQDFLNKIFHHHGPGPADSSSLSTLLQYGLYLAGALSFLTICFLLFRRAARQARRLAAQKRGAASVEAILDAGGYAEEAERLAVQGDFKGACRAIYLSLLQNLHEKKVAIFAPAKTNYEYRYLLVSYPQLSSLFASLAEIVEQVWFGNKQAFADDYAQCKKILAEAAVQAESIAAQKARAGADGEI
jgi:hypothetical protein